MARVLAYTSPARGHLFPVTPILEQLVARGHDVALRTLASQVEPMRSRGIDARAIDPEIERIVPDDYLARSPLGAQKRALRAFCRRAQFDADDLRRAIDEARPDVLLVDINALGALAAAEAWGGPWATWCPYRCRCARATRRRSGRVCDRRAGRSGACATPRSRRSSSARSSGCCVRR